MLRCEDRLYRRRNIQILDQGMQTAALVLDVGQEAVHVTAHNLIDLGVL